MMVVAMRAPSMLCKKTLAIIIKRTYQGSRRVKRVSSPVVVGCNAKTARMAQTRRLGPFSWSPPSLSLPVDK
jgi:hypothetical protein